MGDVGSTTLRVHALIVAIFGLALTAGGAYLLILGGSPYYVLAGAAMLACSWWLWCGDERGSWLYAAIVVATLVWAILEAGLDWLALAARVAFIAVLGLWLTLPAVRRRLAWRSSVRRPDVRVFCLVASMLIIIAALLAPRVLPPMMNDGLTAQPPPPALPSAPDQTASAPDQTTSDWTHFGRDLTGNRYAQIAQITPANVSRLKMAWSYQTGNLPKGAFFDENTPLEVGGKLFVCTPNRWVIALDAANGKVLWHFVPPPDTLGPSMPPNCRGISYHADEASQRTCGHRIFLSTPRGDLWALDADTGNRCTDFGHDGAISLLDGLGPMTARDWVNTSPGAVVGDVIIVGAKVRDNQSVHMPSGVIRAFDVHSGSLVWAWDMGRPERLGAPPPGEVYTESTPNAWAPFSADSVLSLVYVPMGNPSPDFFGAYRRPFDEKYGTSLVALDVHTGRPRWSFQMVHHDLWDYDLPSQPLLVDWPTASGPRKAVVQLTKTGDIFVLDRASGVPLVPVRETPVTRSGGVADDRTSPTQPVSALSLAPHPLQESDMWGLTPIDQMLCRISYRQSRYAGAYTAPGLSTMTFYPSEGGIFNWGDGTVDPRNELLVANANYTPFQINLLPRAQGDVQVRSTTEMGLVEMAGTPYRGNTRVMLSVLAMPCNRPPWGELVAIDMQTGKLRWREPFGTGRESGPLGIKSRIPFAVGTPSFGGSLITGGGLIFIAATSDRYLRAIEVTTGKELWRASLPAGGNATPMSYVAGGRQFIVIAAGGHTYLHSKPGDYVLAYSLDGEATAP